MAPRVNHALDSLDAWKECARNKVVNSVSLDTFKMEWDALCVLIRCMGALSVPEVKRALSAPIVSYRLIQLRVVVNAT